MPKEYDPIMCMMVDKPSRVRDGKAGELWYLSVDGKHVTVFEAWGAPVSEAKAYMKKHNIQGVGTLQKLGRGGKFSVSARDNIRITDDKQRDLRAFEQITKLANSLGKSEDILHDFAVIKQTAAGIKDKDIKAKADRVVNMLASRIRGAK